MKRLAYLLPVLILLVAFVPGTGVFTNLTITGDHSFNTPYAEMYDNTGIVTSITPNDVYYTITGFTTGLNNEVTVDDSIFTITKAGVYRVSMNQAFISSNNSMVCHVSVFVDDVESQVESERKMGTSSDVGSSSGGGLLSLAVGEVVKLKAKANSGTTITFQHINFVINKIN